MSFGFALVGLLFAARAAPQGVDFQQLRLQDARLATVAFRLFSANADRCPSTRPSAGWALHSLSQYPPETREAMTRRTGLQPGLPGVLAVATGGPAAAAGIRADDLLLSADGRDLAWPAPAGPAAEAENAGHGQALDDALADGSAALTFARGSQPGAAVVEAVTACALASQITLTDTLAAEADDRVMSVSFKLASYAASDDELAFVVAHELGHVVLRHKALRTSGEDPGSPLDRERAADNIAIELMAQAGYAPRAAVAFWERLSNDYPAVNAPQSQHPSAEDRRKALAEAIEETEHPENRR